MAALYGVAVARVHAFAEGNKRTALLAVDGFLYANGIEFDVSGSQIEAAGVFEAVAVGEMDYRALSDWISKYCAAPEAAFSEILDQLYGRSRQDPDPDETR